MVDVGIEGLIPRVERAREGGKRGGEELRKEGKVKEEGVKREEEGERSKERGGHHHGRQCGSEEGKQQATAPACSPCAGSPPCKCDSILLGPDAISLPHTASPPHCLSLGKAAGFIGKASVVAASEQRRTGWRGWQAQTSNGTGEYCV